MHVDLYQVLLLLLPLLLLLLLLQGITSSLEAYYQQAGRAGRDGLPAHCSLMWTPQDFMVGATTLPFHHTNFTIQGAKSD
jgi:hypothetical protein